MAQATLPPWIQALQGRDPEFVDSYMAQRERIMRDGAIPAKYKKLTGVTLSVVIRCEPCLAYQIKRPELARSGVAEHVQQLCGKLAAPRRCVGDGGRCTATRRPP